MTAKVLQSITAVLIGLATTSCVTATDNAQLEPTIAQRRQALTCAANVVANLESDPGVVYFYIAPPESGGDDGNDGDSCQSPLATLGAVQSRILDLENIPNSVEARDPGGAIQHSYTVYVRGGTYSQMRTPWRLASPDENIWVRILSFPGETPVFDGEGNQNEAFVCDIRRGEETHIQISGITFTHYMNAIRFKGGADPLTQWNGGALIAHNVFYEVGDEFTEDYCNSRSGSCIGASVIGLRRSRFNTVEHNQVYKAVSRDRAESKNGQGAYAGGSRGVMHFVYLSEYAMGNLVQDNYMSHISGDLFNLRWGSSGNEFYRNYATDSGSVAVFACYGEPDPSGQDVGCYDNVGKNNVATFGYPVVDTNPNYCRDPISETTVDIDPGENLQDPILLDYFGGPYSGKPTFTTADNVFIGTRPLHERIGGLTLGDLDGDGKKEVIVALNYGFNYSKIVSTDGETPYLSRVIYAGSNRGVTIGNLATGHFDSSSSEQLVSSWLRVHPLPFRAEVWFGDGSLLTDGNNGARMTQLYGHDQRRVDALAAGNFDGTGLDELVTARYVASTGKAYVNRGDGLTGLGPVIYQSSTWQVQAMVGGDLHDYGLDRLYTALYKDSSDTLQLWEGDGVDSVKDTNLYEATDRTAKSLAVQDGHRLFASFAFNSGAADRIMSSTENQPGAFSLLIQAGSGFSLSHVAPPIGASTTPLYVSQSLSPDVDFVFGDQTIHEWEAPPTPITCNK